VYATRVALTAGKHDR